MMNDFNSSKNMTPEELQKHFDGGAKEVVIETKSGSQYAIAYDIFGGYEPETDYVYGYRTNGSMGGPFIKKERNGTVRWFNLSNVKFLEARF